jgi:hypothetical protein
VLYGTVQDYVWQPGSTGFFFTVQRVSISVTREPDKCSALCSMPRSDELSAVHRPKPEFVLLCFVLPQSATQPEITITFVTLKLTPTDTKLGEPRATVNSIF